MKQLTALLLCLLLWGCSRQTAPAEPPPEAEAVSAEAGLYDPGHPMEQRYPGLVRAYPLPFPKVLGIRALGKDVLVFSGYGGTTMTVFTGEDLQKAASLTLDFALQPEEPSLQIRENTLSYFDPVRLETVLLDHRLQELRRIAAPEGLSGTPLLSPDGNILYYCTGWSVAAWNLSTGIRRTVKELSYESQELTALHLDGQILECTIRDRDTATRLLLSSDQGLEVDTLPDTARLHTAGGRYFAELTSGYQTLMVFGQAGEAPELLLPEHVWQQQFYLPEDHAAVTVSAGEDGTRLDYFELNTGSLRSALELEGTQTIRHLVNSRDHAVYILAHDPDADQEILYRWDVLRQPPDPASVRSCRTAYHSPEDPDIQALEACMEYAKTIGETYGITVRVWEEAVHTQPWDYRFQPEALAPVLYKELKLLQQRLDRYPEGVLQQTREHFAGLTICLVRQISGTGEEGSLSSATGIQFFQDNEAYVVITTGRHSEQALYHELYHVMETHILTESTALDPWESLNPAGFVYGGSQDGSDVYLQGQTKAFVDRYSMSALKEDRARILENAMLPGKQALFRSEYMQRKLNALCTGIREAYHLKKHPESLPWEQYLVTPLVPEI